MTLKSRIAASLLLTGSVLASSSAFAGGNVNVSESVTLNAKPAAVWALIGDYNGLYRWHPAVAKSERSSSVRELTLGNGAQLTETLLAQDDTARSYSYRIDQSPLPVANYESTLSVEAEGKNGSVVTWSSSFNAAGSTDDDAENVIRSVYRAGLDNLAKLYN